MIKRHKNMDRPLPDLLKNILLILFFGLAISQSDLSAICLQGNCYNGKGTYQFDDNGVYNGEWKNGRMHGIGRFTYQDDWVEGVWEEAVLIRILKQKARLRSIPMNKPQENPFRCIHGDCEDGLGTFRYENGQYTGYWHKKNKHGSGDFYWNEGNHYSGEWRHDEMTGFGFLEFENGDRFSGKWYKGKRHGKGILWKVDGSTIEGEWEHGKMLSSTATLSQPGKNAKISNRDLLNYIFYSNQSINKNIYRLKSRLSALQSVNQPPDQTTNAASAQKIVACLEAKEEILRVQEAIEGRLALEKKIVQGSAALTIQSSEEQATSYYPDKIYTYQDLVEAQSKERLACAEIESLINKVPGRNQHE